MSTVSEAPARKVEESSKAVDPFRDLRGQALVALIRMMVESARARMPTDVLTPEPDSIRALQGKSYGSFASPDVERSLSGRAAELDPTNILTGTVTDASTETVVHERTMGHFVGMGLEPVVRPVRGMTVTSRALEEISRTRWRVTKFDETMEQVLSDARLRGTGGVHVFLDPGVGLARAVRVRPRAIVLDPDCEGDISRTKWRAVVKLVPRSQVRQLWGDDVAERAGTRLEPGTQLTAAQLIHRELDRVEVIDFYYRHRGIVRNVVLVEGVEEPVVDRDGWPYDLPPGFWPIVVFRWYTAPDEVYGRSDFSAASAWHELFSWMIRFLASGAAQSAKRALIYDPGLFTQADAESLLENLRKPFVAVRARLRDIAMSGISLQNVLASVSLGSEVERLTPIVELVRTMLAETTLLRDMEAASQSGRKPPRLARSIARWRKFVAEVLAVQCMIELQLVPKQAMVELAEVVGDRVQVRTVYMDLWDARKLERNFVPNAIQRGLSGDEFDADTKEEYELRRRVAVRDGARMRLLRPEERVRIVHPGVAAYVSRQVMVDNWPGGRMDPLQVMAEFEFDVKVVDPLEQTSEELGKWLELLERLTGLYSELGMKEALLAWGAAYQQAAQEGRQPPKPPKMVANFLALHRNVVQSAGLSQRGELDIGSEDLAAALAQSVAAQQQAQRQQVEQEQSVDRERLALQERLAQAKLQAESLKQQAEIARQWAEFQREMNRVLIEAQKLRTQREHGKYLVEQQKARAAAAHARAVREAVEAKRIVSGENQAGGETE